LDSLPHFGAEQQQKFLYDESLPGVEKGSETLEDANVNMRKVEAERLREGEKVVSADKVQKNKYLLGMLKKLNHISEEENMIKQVGSEYATGLAQTLKEKSYGRPSSGILSNSGKASQPYSPALTAGNRMDRKKKERFKTAQASRPRRAS